MSPNKEDKKFMYSTNKIKTFTPILPAGQGTTGTSARECVEEILNEFVADHNKQ